MNISVNRWKQGAFSFLEVPSRSDVQIFKPLIRNPASGSCQNTLTEWAGHDLVEQAAPRPWSLRPQSHPKLSWALSWRSRQGVRPPGWSACCARRCDTASSGSQAIYFTLPVRKMWNYFCFRPAGESCALQSWRYRWRRRSAGGTGM